MEYHKNPSPKRVENPRQGRFNIRMEKRIIDELRAIAVSQDRSLNDLFKEMSASIIRFYSVDLREVFLNQISQTNTKKAHKLEEENPQLESVLKLIEQKKKEASIPPHKKLRQEELP